MGEEKKHGIEKIGLVVGDKMTKTRVVLVEEVTTHPIYRKRIRVRRKFYVHDEHNTSKAGDTVRILQSRPLSKLKRWRIVEILKHATKTEGGLTNGSVADNS